MRNVTIRLTPAAKKFMAEKGIKDVTFEIVSLNGRRGGGLIKEIEPVYQAPFDASGYRYFQVKDYHIFIARQIRILGPLTVTVEGIWKMKRLFLDGATPNLAFWILE